MEFFIKTADATDFPTIEKLAQEIMSGHYIPIFGKPKTDYLLEKFYQAHALEKQHSEGQVFQLVVDGNGAAIGFLGFKDMGEGRFFLHKFYIKSEGQGRGVGSMVLQKMLAEIGPGLREMRLNVNRLNFNSINFYFKNGFFIENWADIPVGDGFEMNVFQMVFLKK